MKLPKGSSSSLNMYLGSIKIMYDFNGFELDMTDLITDYNRLLKRVSMQPKVKQRLRNKLAI